MALLRWIGKKPSQALGSTYACWRMTLLVALQHNHNASDTAWGTPIGYRRRENLRGTAGLPLPRLEPERADRKKSTEAVTRRY